MWFVLFAIVEIVELGLREETEQLILHSDLVSISDF